MSKRAALIALLIASPAAMAQNGPPVRTGPGNYVQLPASAYPPVILPEPTKETPPKAAPVQPIYPQPLDLLGSHKPWRRLDFLGSPKPGRFLDLLGSPKPGRQLDLLGSPKPGRQLELIGAPKPLFSTPPVNSQQQLDQLQAQQRAMQQQVAALQARIQALQQQNGGR